MPLTPTKDGGAFTNPKTPSSSKNTVRQVTRWDAESFGTLSTTRTRRAISAAACSSLGIACTSSRNVDKRSTEMQSGKTRDVCKRVLNVITPQRPSTSSPTGQYKRSKPPNNYFTQHKRGALFDDVRLMTEAGQPPPSSRKFGHLPLLDFVGKGRDTGQTLFYVILKRTKASPIT